MVDCSKVRYFFEEQERLCDFYGCSKCPLSQRNNGTGEVCEYFVRTHTDKAVEIVQKWSDEHPLPKLRTYADDFFEKHPKARSYVENGIRIPTVMWCHVYGECRQHITECSYTQREHCWNRPYPEQGVST